MTKEQALNILVSLVKTSKLTEEERNLCYQALKLLSELEQQPTKHQVVEKVEG